MRKKSYRKRTRKFARKRPYKKSFKAKAKPYEELKIAVKSIDEVVINVGNTNPILSAKVPWYFLEESKGDRTLPGIAGQGIFRNALNNYERYQPIGVKVKFTPSYGVTQN